MLNIYGGMHMTTNAIATH